MQAPVKYPIYTTVIEAQPLPEKVRTAVSLFHQNKLYVIGKGANNTVYSIDDTHVLRVTDYRLRDHQRDSEFHGLNLQHRLNQCSHIAKIHQYGYIYKTNTDMRVYAVMDKLKGGTLHDKMYNNLDARVNISNKDVVSIMRKLIEALQCIDSNGYCHRDIKADNIMITDKTDITSVQLIDFGFMAECSIEQFSLVGTCGYTHLNSISIHGYTRDVDMWALGILLIELLEGIASTRAICKLQEICISNKQNKMVCPEYYMAVYTLYSNVIKKHPIFKNLLKALLGKHRAWGMMTASSEAFPTHNICNYDKLLLILDDINLDGGRRKSVRNSRVDKRKSKKIFRKKIKLTRKKNNKKKLDFA